MSPPELLGLHGAAIVIDLVGSVLLAGYAAAAFVCLTRRHGPRAARLVIADGATLALTFKVAAALLKTIELNSWNQIGLFAAALALRVLLKSLFSWEAQRLRRQGDAGTVSGGVT